MIRRLLLPTLCLLLGAGGTWELSKATTFQLSGEAVARVDTTQPIIALTFDDGPVPRHLRSVLSDLETVNVPATFFLVGQDVERHPDLVRQIAEAGHEIGNHSFTHRRLILMGQSAIADELQRTDDALRAAGYDGPIRFRPPYGQKLVNLPRHLAATDRPSIMWDVSLDGEPEFANDPDALAAAVIEATEPGSILLLHVMFDANRTSREALPLILSGLKGRGYRFVTISELLALREGDAR